jgi:hypothetical protein
VKSAHLDYETLADLAEGLLDDEPAASAAEHLADCDECRERSAELAEVSRLLAESPVPPMPAELAARIDAAVAAESMSTATVTSMQARRDRRHLRMLSAAAAAIVVVGGGAMVTRSVMEPSLSSDHPSHRPSAPLQEHQDRSGDGSPSTRVAPDTAEHGPDAGYVVAGSGTDYRKNTLGHQVAAELKRDGRPVIQPPARLSECVARIAGGKTPLLVDAARYEGTPATVIALSGARSRDLDVWIVGPGCSARSTDVIGHVQSSR